VLLVKLLIKAFELTMECRRSGLLSVFGGGAWAARVAFKKAVKTPNRELGESSKGARIEGRAASKEEYETGRLKMVWDEHASQLRPQSPFGVDINSNPAMLRWVIGELSLLREQVGKVAETNASTKAIVDSLKSTPTTTQANDGHHHSGHHRSPLSRRESPRTLRAESGSKYDDCPPAHQAGSRHCVRVRRSDSKPGSGQPSPRSSQPSPRTAGQPSPRGTDSPHAISSTPPPPVTVLHSPLALEKVAAAASPLVSLGGIGVHPC